MVDSPKATNTGRGLWEDILLDPDLEIGQPAQPAKKRTLKPEVSREEQYEWTLHQQIKKWTGRRCLLGFSSLSNMDKSYIERKE